MNSIQRFAVRLAAKIAPPLGSLLRNSGGTVERLEEQVQLYRERENDRQYEAGRLRAELVEAIGLSNGGPWQGVGAISESAQPGDSKPVIRLKERLADLELALEDRGWKRQLALSEYEFSRYGIQQIILISRLYFIKNPLIRRGVKVSAMYVFGRGIEISSENRAAQKALTAFMEDPLNMKELGHSALVAKEEALHTDGNLFLAFFTSPEDGSVQLRSIDPLEIEEIIRDPDDAAVTWFYHRRWTSQRFDSTSGLCIPKWEDAWYCDIDYTDYQGNIQGRPLQRDTAGQLIPILHQKVGGLNKWHFGCPMVYGALDWARAYKNGLEDYCTILRALSRFSWNVETQGGAPAIAAFKATLATTLGMDGISAESNPPPTTGSAFVSGPGNKLTPIKTAGATTELEGFRRVMLMVAAHFGLPETFFGDSSTGSLATAQSLDRPTELQFLQHQERWRELLQRVCQYVLDQSANAPRGKLKEAQQHGKDAIVDIKFPSVLEHDINQRIAALVSSMTLDGYPVTGIDEKTGIALLLAEIGVEDVQAVIDAMYPEGEYDPDRTKIPPLPDPNDPNTPQVAPNGAAPKTTQLKAKEAVTLRAIQELRKAVVKLQEKKAKP